MRDNAPLYNHGIENYKPFEGAAMVKRNVPFWECVSALSSWEGIGEVMASILGQIFINHCGLAMCLERGLQIIIQQTFIIWNFM